jgi:hypothetical protein
LAENPTCRAASAPDHASAFEDAKISGLIRQEDFAVGIGEVRIPPCDRILKKRG